MDRYDWANHWARVAAPTSEERAKLPSAINPQERPAPIAKDEPCYASPDEFSRRVDPDSAAKYSSNSRRRRSIKAPERPGSLGTDSTAAVAGSNPPENRENFVESPSYKYMADWDFGFAAVTTPSSLRPDDYSSSLWSQVNQADASRKRQ